MTHLLTTVPRTSSDAGPIVEGTITGAEALRAGVVVAVAVALALAVRLLLVRALDREDSDRYVGRLLGRFLSVLVVAVGLGEHQGRVEDINLRTV